MPSGKPGVTTGDPARYEFSDSLHVARQFGRYCAAAMAGGWEDSPYKRHGLGRFFCGPVPPEQIRLAEALIRDPEAIIASDAAKASELFNATGRRRGTLADCIIAAICLRLNASIATNNLDDFRPFEPFGLRIEPV